MANFKIVIAEPKSGKCYQKEVKEPDSKSMLGMKIGDTVKGELMGLTGYEFVITGGSDYCGFPMRKDVIGSARKKIFAVQGIGIQEVEFGERRRKTVAGNTVFDRTSQINVKVVKYGKEPLAPPAADAEKSQEPAPAGAEAIPDSKAEKK